MGKATKYNAGVQVIECDTMEEIDEVFALTIAKMQEDCVRRLARRRGYRLRKQRGQPLYHVVDKFGTVQFGRNEHFNFTASLDAVERWLTA